MIDAPRSRSAHYSMHVEAPHFAFRSIVGRSPEILAAVDLARRVAESRRTTVLVLGETGTGKELIARGIHYSGADSGEPFVAVNCAAIPHALLESELFGFEPGAFTGAEMSKPGLVELAGDGTLFLDEIHQLPSSLQPKLLRLLEARTFRRLGGHGEFPVRCRIVAAANVSLENAVASGDFREDLYYRLAVFTVPLPSLRDRPRDIDVIARHFLAQSATAQRRAPKSLSADAANALRSHGWPGNVRELKNVIERAFILSGDELTIRPEHIMIQHRISRPVTAASPDAAGEITIPRSGKTLSEVEREAAQLTMRVTGGNQSAAAKLLGISRPTLARILKDGHAAQRTKLVAAG
jgi:transcriptional regulator with PAS, ATPase and Fis domain